jgi:hypothetical protein
MMLPASGLTALALPPVREGHPTRARGGRRPGTDNGGAIIILLTHAGGEERLAAPVSGDAGRRRRYDVFGGAAGARAREVDRALSAWRKEEGTRSGERLGGCLDPIWIDNCLEAAAAVERTGVGYASMVWTDRREEGNQERGEKKMWGRDEDG